MSSRRSSSATPLILIKRYPNRKLHDMLGAKRGDEFRGRSQRDHLSRALHGALRTTGTRHEGSSS